MSRQFESLGEILQRYEEAKAESELADAVLTPAERAHVQQLREAEAEHRECVALWEGEILEVCAQVTAAIQERPYEGSEFLGGAWRRHFADIAFDLGRAQQMALMALGAVALEDRALEEGEAERVDEEPAAASEPSVPPIAVPSPEVWN